MNTLMRTLAAVLIGVVLFSRCPENPEQGRLPTVSADALTFSEVRRIPDTAASADLEAGRDALVVQRLADVRAGERSSVFVLEQDGLLRRVAVEYGRSSSSLIEVLSGVSAGDRIVISDIRAWDAFDRLRVRR